jgi:hypothetical protein
MRARASPPLPPYQKGKPSAFLCLLLLSLFMAAGVSGMQQVCCLIRPQLGFVSTFVGGSTWISLGLPWPADASFLRNFIVIRVWR